MKTLLAVILQQIKKKTTKMKMKKVIIFAGLLLAMSHTAFAEQCGVFMEFHRKVNPEHTRDVNRAPLRLPIDVVYDSDTHKIEVVGNEEMEVQIFLCDENGNTLDYSSYINAELNIPYNYSGLIILRIECEKWIAIGKITV